MANPEKSQIETGASTPIKTVEALSKSILDDPNTNKSFHKYIEAKYGLESNTEILSVTSDELNKLKSEITGDNSDKNFDTLGKFVYQDYISNKIETEGLNGVNLNMITTGIDSHRLNDLKDKFELLFNDKFKKYDFLSSSQKEVFKIVLVNKIIKSQATSLSEGIMGTIGSTINTASKKLSDGEISDAYGTIKDGVDVSEISNMGDQIEKIVKESIGEYTEKLDMVQEKINQKHSTLKDKHIQLQNIFSHVEAFKNPDFIENDFLNFDISTIDFTSKDSFNNTLNNTQLVDYIIGSRENVTDIVEKLKSGDEVMDGALSLLSDKNMGGVMKGFLDVLLKIPFIGDFIANFLGLDPNDPIGDLDKITGQYQFFQGLLSQGQKEGKEGLVEGKGIFKNVDFGSQSFSQNKDIIGNINGLIPNLNEKQVTEFWQKSFSKDGYIVDGISLKFEGLQDLDNFQDGKLKDGKLNEILKKGYNNYNSLLSEKAVQDKQTELTEKEQERLKKIESLEGNILESNKELMLLNNQKKYYEMMLHQDKMDAIDDWNDLFNWGDINDILINDIIDTEEQNMIQLIEEQIGETISDKDKGVLELLFISIKKYFSENPKPKDINSIADIYDNISGMQKFFDFIKQGISNTDTSINSLKEKIATLNSDLELLNKPKTKEEKIAGALWGVSDGSLLDHGVSFGDYEMNYNPETGELKVGDIVYTFQYGTENENFSDIIIENGNIYFNGIGTGTGRLRVGEISSKQDILSHLSKFIVSGEEEKIIPTEGSQVMIKKQTVA